MGIGTNLLGYGPEVDSAVAATLVRQYEYPKLS